MAEKAKKSTGKTKNSKKTGLIVGICSAVVIIALIVVVAVVLIINHNNRLSDSYFVSDDSKYVLTLDANDLVDDENGIKPIKTHYVCTYSGDTITSIKSYYQYADKETAEKALLKYKSENEGLYQDIGLDGDFLIVTSKESDYNGTSASEMKQLYEFMEANKRLNDRNNTNSTENTAEPTTETTETTEETTPTTE